MPKVKSKPLSGKEAKEIRPPLTPEAAENQMISLAFDLVRQRLIDGTATSQETVHFLKLGTQKERYERERLAEEIKLLKAKTKAVENTEDMKVVYEEALKAMRRYSGHGDDDEY